VRLVGVEMGFEDEFVADVDGELHIAMLSPDTAAS
jgi:hypothetical protein